jgi:hypothetical protein
LLGGHPASCRSRRRGDDPPPPQYRLAFLQAGIAVRRDRASRIRRRLT